MRFDKLNFKTAFLTLIGIASSISFASTTVWSYNMPEGNDLHLADWYMFTDTTSTTTAELKNTDEGYKELSAILNLDLNESETSFAGFGSSWKEENQTDATVDLSSYTGLCLTYKATKPIRVDFVQPNRTYYHGANLPAQNDFTQAFIDFSTLTQYTWTPSDGELDLTQQSGIRISYDSFIAKELEDENKESNIVTISVVSLGECDNASQNEDSPIIENQTFTFAEKQGDGSDWTSETIVDNILASDPNDDVLTFTVVTEGVPFSFNPGTNQLTVTDGSALDYETKPSWTFEVSASDGNGNSATANITVNLSNVNEPPQFKTVSDLYEVVENESGTVLTGDNILVYDDDANDVNTLTITITDNNPGADPAENLFQAIQTEPTDENHVSKFVIQTKDYLNYETLYKATENGVVFDVTLTLTDGSENVVTKTVQLRVNDANEPPVIANASYAFTISENIAAATSVGSIEASDPDIYSTTFGTLYFSLEGEEAAQFVIDENSGEILTANSINFDYETKSEYNFEVVVTDKEFTKRIPTSVNLANIIEAPQFPESIPTLSIDENTLAGTIVETITTEDDDCKGTFNTTCSLPTYSLAAVGTTDDYTAFTIDQNGTIKLAADSILDHEIKNEYVVRVVAADGEDPSFFNTADITIKVNDVNEAPVILGSSTFSLYEGSGKNFIVGELKSSDTDTAKAFTNNIFTVEGGDTNLFGITEQGEIFAKYDFDYEEDFHTFELTVALSDKDSLNNPDFKTTQNITITLLNINEPPAITSTEFSVKENSKEGTLIGTIKAKDPDGDTNLSFMLNKNNSYVTVSSNGEIRVAKNATIDYEKMQNFIISASVEDAEGSRSTSDITIKVIDVVEVSSSSSSKVVSSSSRTSSSSTKPKSSSSKKATSSSSQNNKSSSSFWNGITTSSSSQYIYPIHSSSSSDNGNGGIIYAKPSFRVKMTAPFEFEIVMDETLPSLAKRYAVMDMKGQVLSVGELSDKGARIKVPTSGSYVVKVGLGYRRVNVR